MKNETFELVIIHIKADMYFAFRISANIYKKLTSHLRISVNIYTQHHWELF